MKPKEFDGQNVIFAENQPEYNPLPAFKSDNGIVVTCWELNDDEKKRIIETGEIYICLNTFNQPLQPIFVTTIKDEAFEV